MNVTRSRSMRSSAASGSQRAMNTVRNGTTPGRVMPLSRPEMCAHGAGISTQSSVRRSCTSAMSAALYASVACVCSTPFGCAARARREQHGRELLALGPQLGDRRAVGQRVEIVDDELRARRLVASARLPARRADGAAAPRSRRGASTRGRAARLRRGCADCHATASPGSTPCARSPPATRATRSASSAGARAVSSSSSDGRSHAPPGVPVRVGERRLERRCEHGAVGPQARRSFQPSLAGVAPRSTLVPMKLRWISTVPAPMHSPRMSRYTRSTGYSREKP